MYQTFDSRTVLPSMIVPAFVTSIIEGVWLALAAKALNMPEGVLLPLLALIIIGTLAFLIASIRFARNARRVATGASPLRDRRRLLMYIGAVAFEFVAYIVGYNILNGLHRLDLVIPLLAFVVGIHFFGLIPVFQTTRYIVVAAVFCLAAIIAVFLPSAVPLASYTVNGRVLFVGAVCGLYMWYVALRLLSQGRRWIQDANAGSGAGVAARG
jgi:hypothetical protein